MKKVVGLVLLLLAIVGTVNVIRKFAQDQSAQTPTQATDSSAYGKGQKVGKYSAPFVLVLLGVWGLRLLLSSDESATAAPTPRRSPTSDLPPPGHPSLRGGQDTFATNPAMLKLSAAQWLAANPWVPSVSAVLAVAGVAFLFIKLPVGLVLLGTAVYLPFKEVREAKDKFFGGDVCPGIVLSAEQNLVAVYTDLVAAGDRPYPVIQILKQPLHRMTTGRAFDGMRVATTALYLGNKHEAAWKNFWPEVINCVIHDPTEIERVLGSISEREWQMLDACLAQIPVAKLGLHHLAPASLAAVAAAGSDLPYTSVESGFAPARPWFQSPVAIFALAALGLIAALTIASFIVVALARPKNPPAFPDHPPMITHSPPAPPPTWAPPRSPQNAPVPPSVQPPQSPPGAGPPVPPTQAGPYAVASQVLVNWAGGWIPGTITKINYGGHSVTVKLDDARFPYPIVVSTNQLRLK